MVELVFGIHFTHISASIIIIFQMNINWPHIGIPRDPWSPLKSSFLPSFTDPADIRLYRVFFLFYIKSFTSSNSIHLQLLSSRNLFFIYHQKTIIINISIFKLWFTRNSQRSAIHRLIYSCSKLAKFARSLTY